jgi:cell wall-associated NlpC family hydrolase
VPVDDWGQLTLEASAGRLTAPLVIRLLQPHSGLLAGTTVAVAFAAGPQQVAGSNHSAPSAGSNAESKPRAARASTKTKKHPLQPQKPPPDFPASPFPFVLDGHLTKAAQDNPVVSIAMQYLGVPYLWGGASPKTGFDCSGLVMYVFAQLGVHLTHYAAAQYHAPDGVWVAPNRLRPGDLVFFVGSDGTRKAPGHVGIYVGDGYLIDAPHTGSFVRIDNLDEPKLANQYVGARRIVTQLVDARHLLRVNDDAAPTSDILSRMFPQEPILGAAGLSTAPIAAAAFHSASNDAALLSAAPLGGGLVILLLAGAFVFHRRRSAPNTTADRGSSS